MKRKPYHLANDPLIRDLFADAVEPPKPAQLLNRCKHGCNYKTTFPVQQWPRCTHCDHPFPETTRKRGPQ